MIKYKIIEIKTDYMSTHTPDDCDKCQKFTGKENLFKVPFIFKNYSDEDHPDVIGYDGYKQYWICKSCYKELMKTFPKRQ